MLYIVIWDIKNPTKVDSKQFKYIQSDLVDVVTGHMWTRTGTKWRVTFLPNKIQQFSVSSYTLED